MQRLLLVCCGIVLASVAAIILGLAPHWYTNEEHKVPTALTQIAGIALIVQGAVVALVAALSFARGLVPLARTLSVSGSSSLTAGGGPVLPLCGFLFLLSGFGPLERSQHAAKEYAFAQTRPGEFQDWAVDLERRLVPIGRTFAVLWFGIGGALIATPLYVKPHVWQLRRRLNRCGRNYAIGGLLLSVVGILAWFLNASGNAIGGGRNSSHELSVVGYLGIIAGAVVAAVGSIAAVAGSGPGPTQVGSH